jgi:hypothetical protein
VEAMSEIDTYRPGRELDIMIAEEVFGIVVERDRFGQLGYWRKVGNYKEGGFESNTWYDLAEYSTDDHDALKIVKHLCQDGREPNELYFKLVYGWWYKADREKKGYPLVRAVFDWKEAGDSNPLYQALAETIPLAICRAALRVVREDLSLPEVER